MTSGSVARMEGIVSQRFSEQDAGASIERGATSATIKPRLVASENAVV